MMPKQRCIKIYANNTYDDKKFKIEGLNIKDGKDGVQFSPLCVLKENKPKGRFWRGTKTLIVFVEDALEALHFNKGDDTMQLAWGKSEAREYMFKLEALASVSVKPIKTWQFGVIILMLLFALVLGIVNLWKLGALGV